jgi:hypothetical protein
MWAYSESYIDEYDGETVSDFIPNWAAIVGTTQPSGFTYFGSLSQVGDGFEEAYGVQLVPRIWVQRRLKPPTMKDSSVLVAFQIRFSKGKQKLISQTRSRVPDDARAIARVTLADARQIRGRRLRRDVVRAAR